MQSVKNYNKNSVVVSGSYRSVRSLQINYSHVSRGHLPDYKKKIDTIKRCIWGDCHKRYAISCNKSFSYTFNFFSQKYKAATHICSTIISHQSVLLYDKIDCSTVSPERGLKRIRLVLAVKSESLHKTI